MKDELPSMQCHDGCLVCNYAASREDPDRPEGEVERAINAFFHGYAQALAHGTAGLAVHLDQVCTQHRAGLEHYINSTMKFAAEHLAQGGEFEKETVN